LHKVDIAGIAAIEDISEAPFNPINMLGQYLMRNNPKYSSAAKDSAYMKSLAAIQSQLKGKALDESREKSQALWSDVRQRMEATRKQVEAEREAARQLVIAKISALWAAAQKWMDTDRTVDSRSLVWGFHEFATYLDDHAKTDGSLVALFPLVPPLDSVEDGARYTSDVLLENLEAWTAGLRDRINAADLMADLIAHMTEWFETDSGKYGEERKRYRNLFKEVDYYHENEISVELVTALAKQFVKSGSLPEEETEAYTVALSEWTGREQKEDRVDFTASARLPRNMEEDMATLPSRLPSIAKGDDDEDAAETLPAEAGDEVRGGAAAAEDRPAAGAGEGEPEDEVGAAPVGVDAETASKADAVATTVAQPSAAAIAAAAAPTTAVPRTASGTPLTADGDAAADSDATPSAPDAVPLAAASAADGDIAADGRAEGAESATASTEAGMGEAAAARRSHLDEEPLRDMDTGQFLYFCSSLLGHEPDEGTWEAFRMFVSDGFSAEREVLEQRFREKVRLAERAHQMDLVMERIDVDCSGFIEDDELAPMLQAWRDLGEAEAEAEAGKILADAGPEDATGLLRLGKARFTSVMLKLYFEDLSDYLFEREMAKLNRVLDRILPDHERFMARKRWLEELDTTVASSFCETAPVYAKAFAIIQADADQFSKRRRRCSSSVALATAVHGRVTALTYVAATEDDINEVVGRTLEPAQAPVSYTAVGTGLPEHVTSIVADARVHRFKRRMGGLGGAAATDAAGIGTDSGDGNNGALIVFPLTDPRNNQVPHGVFGTITMDNLSAAAAGGEGGGGSGGGGEGFQAHQVRFFQGVSKHLADGLRAIEIRTKMRRLAQQSTPWIKACSPSGIKAVVWCLVAEGAKGDPQGMSVQKYPPSARGADGKRVGKAGVRVARGVRQNAFIFRCAELRDVTSSKVKGVTYTAFPVVRKGECVMVAVVSCEGSEGSGGKLAPAVERDARRHINEMQEVHRVLLQGDIAPPDDALIPNCCVWHKSKLEIDTLGDAGQTKYYWLRFRLLSLRREAVRAFKMLFYNLNSTAQPTVITLKVIGLMIMAFVGESKGIDFSSWRALRKYVNTDLRRAISEYDPTRAAYKGTLRLIEAKLDLLDREDVADEGQPLVSLVYDWLQVCVHMARRAATLRRSAGALSSEPVIKNGITFDAAEDDELDDPDEPTAATAPVPTRLRRTTDVVAEEPASTASGDEVVAAVEEAASTASGDEVVAAVEEQPASTASVDKVVAAVEEAASTASGDEVLAAVEGAASTAGGDEVVAAVEGLAVTGDESGVVNRAVAAEGVGDEAAVTSAEAPAVTEGGGSTHNASFGSRISNSLYA
jgi:hypothetical protein